ncbi:hypothetical protein FRC10_003806 [Ceratobasidium sp. 414]|nr:hypothetical protein FRC10_003806 [Ceratobasidium sp. 414]
MHEKAIEELLKSLETIASEPEPRAEYSLSVSRKAKAEQLAVSLQVTAAVEGSSDAEVDALGEDDPECQAGA